MGRDPGQPPLALGVSASGAEVGTSGASGTVVFDTVLDQIRVSVPIAAYGSVAPSPGTVLADLRAEAQEVYDIYPVFTDTARNPGTYGAGSC